MRLRLRSWLSLGALAGVVAIAAALAGAATEATGREPTSDLGGLTVLMVFGAGAAVLAQPRRIEALAAADALVAIAITLEMFSRLGTLYIPVLLLLGFATLRAREVQPREAEAARPVLLGDWGERARPEQREQLRRAG